MNFEEFRERYQKEEISEYPNHVPPASMVSVLVQTFQHENYIKACLDSILNQITDFPVEILLGEDGSSDGTREICIDYAKMFPDRIRLFLHSPGNRIKVLDSPTGNFNAFYNFFCARGKYIAFCEGDDNWADVYRLQKEVDFLENHSHFIFTFHSYYNIDYKNDKFIPDPLLVQPDHDISQEELQKIMFHPLLLCTCFRNVFRTLPEEIIEVLNVDSFLFSLLGQYGNGKFLEKISPSRYRNHSGGIWSKREKRKRFLSKMLLYERLVAFYERTKNPNLAQFFKVQHTNVLKMLFIEELKQGKINSIMRLRKNYIRLVLRRLLPLN